jgi:hypothetical protein
MEGHVTEVRFLRNNLSIWLSADTNTQTHLVLNFRLTT